MRFNVHLILSGQSNYPTKKDEHAHFDVRLKSITYGGNVFPMFLLKIPFEFSARLASVLNHIDTEYILIKGYHC